MKKLKKSLIVSLSLSLLLVLTACSSSESGGTKEIVIAEPVHSIGYLPLYVAKHEGYLEEAGLDVEIITATGGGHVTSVVSGEAWGNIGGPESNQMANDGSSDPIVSVVNVVNRANVYLLAATELNYQPTTDPATLKSYFEGKTIAAGRYGGSLNLLTRWLLMDVGLDPATDVKLEEPADPAAVVSLVQNGAAHIANGAEPQIKSGLDLGIWNEPFYKFTDLGDYPYSVINVKKSTIDEDPETVQAFVDAIVKGLETVANDPEKAMEVLKAEFPTTEEASLQAALDRAYEDNLWSKEGFISEESVDKVFDVVEKTGIYTDGYVYDELIDMQFVNK